MSGLMSFLFCRWNRTRIAQSRTYVVAAAAILLVVTGAAHANAGLPAMTAYGVEGEQHPVYRTWDGASWFPPQPTLPIGGETRWCELRSCPTRDEQILVVLDADGHLNAQVCIDSVWGNLLELTTDITPAGSLARGFDVEYEQKSGRAMVVYHEGVPDPRYRIWDGTSWSNPRTVGLTNTTTPNWIELAADPYSNQMGLIVLDIWGCVEAAMWDGLAWMDITTLTWKCKSPGQKSIDVSFFGPYGDALFIWTYDAPPQDCFWYRVHSLGGWHAAGSGPHVGWGVSHVTMSRNGLSDTLAVAFATDNSDAWVALWDGIQFFDKHSFGGTSIASNTSDCIGVAWERSLDQLIVAWGERRQWILAYDSPEATVHSLVSFNGNLYAGTGNNGRVYLYDGSTWSVRADFAETKVFCMREYNGKIYAGVSDQGKVYAFDGASWSLAYDSPEKEIRSFAVYNGKLYAASGSVNGIIYVFDGAVWSQAYNSPEQTVYSLAVYDGKLYAGSGPNGRIYVYDGAAWSVSYDSPDQRILTLAPYNGMLFAGSSPNAIVYVYDGAVWNVSLDIGASEQDIACSQAFENDLYVGTAPNSLILSFDGTSWSVAFDSPDSSITSLGVHDGALYAGSTLNGLIYRLSERITKTKYCTWSKGIWSAETLGPDLSEQVGLVSLTASPANDEVFMETATDDHRIQATRWDGDAWQSPKDLESKAPTLWQMPFSLCYGIGQIPPPILASPADGSWLADATPTFTWITPVYPYELSYRIEIDSDSLFSPPIDLIDFTTEMTYTPTANLTDGEHFWRVAASDSMGRIGEFSSVWMFGIDTQPPDKPQLLTADGTNPSPWKNSPVFQIDMDYPPDLTGISNHFYKLGTHPVSLDDTSGTSGVKPFDVQAGMTGGESLFVWLSDGLGNANYANWDYVILRFDDRPPQGSSAKSPLLSNTEEFEVTWTKGRDFGGSGLTGEYDVMFRDGSGPWQQWLSEYAGLSDTFDGIAGHMYYFEAAAIDSAGNVESLLGAPECSTFVDTTRPYVASTKPSNGETGVGIDTGIIVVFSEEMNDATLDSSKITVSGVISGVHEYNAYYSNDTLNLELLNPFSYGEQATLIVRKEVEDLAGNSMENDKIVTFTLVPDTISPYVVTTVPADGDTGVPLETDIIVVFSEEMNAATLDTTNITISGTLSGPHDFNSHCSGDSLNLEPLNGFWFGELVTVTVAKEVEDLAGNGMLSDKLFTFKTSRDSLRPYVVSTIPEDGDTLISIETDIIVVFSEEMNVSTLDTVNIAVWGATSGIHRFNRNYFNDTLNLEPLNPFSFGEPVMVTVRKEVEDLAGNAMAGDKAFTFRTMPDTTRPFVVSTAPADSDTCVSIATDITIVFSEEMNVATLDTPNIVISADSSGPHAFARNYSSDTLNLEPLNPFVFGELVTVVVREEVEDLAGNTMLRDETFMFRTMADTTPDTTRPFVVSTVPADSDTGVSIFTDIVIVFSEEMSVATLDTPNIVISADSSGPHAFTRNYSSDTLNLEPLNPFSFGELVTVIVRKEVEDLSGNQMATDYTLGFTLGLAVDSLGPVIESLSTDPQQPQQGTHYLSVDALVSDSATGMSLVAGAQLQVDSTDGAPLWMSAKDGSFDSWKEEVTYTLNIINWNAGEAHIVYVRGRDSKVNWGKFDSAFVYVVASEDTIPPRIASTFPESADVNIPPNTWIYLRFSEKVDRESIVKEMIELDGDRSGTHDFWMSYDDLDSTLSINPITNFISEETVSVYIASGIRDLAGNPMQQDYFFWFSVLDPPDTTGPWVTAISAKPDTLYLNPKVVLRTTIVDDRRVVEAECFADSVGLEGEGTHLTEPGGFGSDSIAHTLDTLAVNHLGYGTHWLYVRGKDGSQNWGDFDSVSIYIQEPDTISPTFVITVTPQPAILGESAWVEVRPSRPLSSVPACSLWDTEQNCIAVTLKDADSTYTGSFLTAGLRVGVGRIQASGVDIFGNAGSSDTTCAVIAGPDLLPSRLVYVYPNPAPSESYGDYVHFRFYVGSNADVRLDIFTVDGKLIDKLDGTGKGGSKENEMVWNIRSLASQFLFYRLQAKSKENGETRAVMKKLAILK